MWFFVCLFFVFFCFCFFFFVPVTQFCLVSICLCFSLFAFFLNTNIVVDYIIGKAGNELVSFFNSLYQDD